MAIEITNKRVVYDTSDPTVVTDEKSLVKINSTTYNIFDNWFDFIRKYFGVDDYNDPYISTLKSSFFGYFNEIASSEIKNAVFHKNFLYDEHFLNTAILPESIYNFAKMYNVPIENAIPANMYISIFVSESELVNSALLKEVETDSITNANANTLKVYNLTIDRTTAFVVNGYRFMLPYPLILTIQEMQTDNDQTAYSYSANYDTTANNFPILENEGVQPYIKVWRETVDGTRYLFIGCQVYQMVKTQNTITITTTNENPDSLYHNIEFNDQLAYFEAFYEFNGKIVPVNLYFNNIYTPTEEEYYAYYTYLNDQTLQISFSSNIDGFKPAVGSTLTVNTYTTQGYNGNFDYSGGVTMNYLNNNTFAHLNFNCTTMLDGSKDGKDRLDTIGQKTKILEAIVTRNNIITDNDLIKYFDSINESLNVNGSTIKFIKKQDDVIKRIYCNFLLLRDENRRVIPTNTAPHLKIKASDLEKTNSDGKFVIKEHSIVQCNYVRDIENYNPLLIYNEDMKIDDFDSYFNKEESLRYSQDYIKYFINNNYYQDILDNESSVFKEAFNDIESIYDKMNTEQAEIKSDELIYTIPFMIAIEKEPFLKATYYNVDINSEIALSYEYLNNKVGASFSISTLKIYKDINPSASNKFTLDSNVYKLSFNLNTNLSYDDIKDKVVIKCVIGDKNNDETNYGHFFFTLKSVTTNTSSNIVTYSYLYEAELSTDYSFTNGKLNMYDSLYKVEGKSGRSILYKNAPIAEDVIFKIGILYYNPILALTQTINEKKDWAYKFPVGFIQSMEEPTAIAAANISNLSELVSWDDTEKIDGYIDPQSILLLPPEVDDFSVNYYGESELEKTDIDGNLINEKRKDDVGLCSSFYNMESYTDGKLVIKILDSYKTNNTNKTDYLKLDGYVKILIPNFTDNSSIEIGHHIVYDESYTDFGNPNPDNIDIKKVIEQNGTKYITITINNIASITSDINISYAKLINKIEKNVFDNESTFIYTRDNHLIDMDSNMGYSVIQNIIEMDTVALAFYDINRIVNNTETQDFNTTLSDLSIESIELGRTDDEIVEETNSRDNIDNYVLATIISNPTPLKMYQNMSSLMSSIITYNEEKDEYDLELVPLISLRYYMARPQTIYDLLTKFINIVNETLPRLENNTNCDLKFYNTYGPSRYFYFTKEIISKTVYTNSETNEEISENDEDFNPYINTVITENSYVKYNYLGRTDVILDFTIYLYENITSEKDEELKKYISDYVEEANTELILPISNLITQLEKNFPIIKYIKYNGIFSDIVDSNDSSKNNDYQLIDNDFDFNNMNKDQIRTYVPEYLNLKKDVIKLKENYNAEDIFDILQYSTYDYVINIKYKV